MTPGKELVGLQEIFFWKKEVKGMKDFDARLGAGIPEALGENLGNLEKNPCREAHKLAQSLGH